MGSRLRTSGGRLLLNVLEMKARLRVWARGDLILSKRFSLRAGGSEEAQKGDLLMLKETVKLVGVRMH